jgi:membrane protein
MSQLDGRTNETDRDAPLAQAAPLPDALGHAARTPAGISWRGWRAVLFRTGREVVSDRVSLVAAGCAFWSTLALFPALSMLISIYGLVFNLSTVMNQLDVLRDLLPAPMFDMISNAIKGLVSHPANAMGVRVAISAASTLWAAAVGTKSLLAALNMAYEETEHRGFIRFQFVSLVMTLSAIVGVIVGMAMLLFLPTVLDFVGFGWHRQLMISLVSNVVLAVFVVMGLSFLYRFGPSRRHARWSWVTPGSVVATLIWFIASLGYSWYLQHIAVYDVLYGPLGAVAGILMWFWVSAYAVLLGAELNSELELQTSYDTTAGHTRPPGTRGAYVADHVAPE